LSIPIVHASEPVTLVGGAELGPDDLSIALKRAPILVAADGGADAVRAAGLRPVAVIGDMDSISAGAATDFADLMHPMPEQDTTDFEKCLTRISAPVVLALGFLGGRTDHTLAAFSVMARLSEPAVVLLGADDVCFVAPPVSIRLTIPVGSRVSLMPLATVRIRAGGLRWPVDGLVLSPAGAVSASNESVADQIDIAADGPVLVILPRAALAAVMDAVTAAARAR
jgi:thiamine pyrophosphokinase